MKTAVKSPAIEAEVLNNLNKEEREQNDKKPGI